MHINHLDDDSTNEQLLRKKTIFCAYVKPCIHLELLLLNDVEKMHMKELFLTLTVQF